MQRIARLFVVVLVVASMLGAIPARAGNDNRVGRCLSQGDTLSTGCKPPAKLGTAAVRVGASTMLLKDGTYVKSSESPANRAGCLYFVDVNVLESEQYAISVGDVDGGIITATEMRDLGNHVQIAIDTNGLTIESEDWRFPDSEAAIASAPTPTATTSSRRTTTQRRSTPTPTVASSSRSRTSDRWGCADLEDYQDELFSLLLRVDEYDAVEELLDADDFTTVRPSVLQRASAGLDEWAGLMEEMDDVPLAAEEYHEAFIDLVSMMATVTISLANGGTFAIVPYADAMETASDDLDTAKSLGERRCGDEWTDVFGF